MKYGEILSNIRKDKNLLQKDIAKILNISPITYSHYESGDAMIPMKHLISISDYLTVSIDYLLGFTKNKKYKNEKTNIDKNLAGTRLKEFRKENKLTQSKLAAILNTTFSVISDYENGRNLIATPFLYTICLKFNISADYLLGKIDSPKNLNPVVL